MKRKMIAALLALMMCMSLAFSVSASPETIFVIDEVGCLSGGELEELNDLASDLYEETGVGAFFVFTLTEPVGIVDLDPIVNDVQDYVVMVKGETDLILFCGGSCESIELGTEDELCAAYEDAQTDADGVEEYLYAAADYFTCAAEILEWGLSEDDEYIKQENDPKVYEKLVFDKANLLSDDEEEALEENLAKISKRYDAQILVYTIDSVDGNVDSYPEKLYEDKGFGYGKDHDGVLLLVCMDPREYRILSNGFAEDAIDTDDKKSIGDAIKPDLSDGNYADAFEEYAEQCAYYLEGDINGFPFDAGKKLVIALVIGVVVGVIVAFVLKGQLKSVRKQNQADVYVKPGSMHITLHNDFFLYRNVTRVKKESGGSSGGRSSRSVGGSF